MKSYQRYHVETRPAPNIVPHPPRFKVNVKKWQLVKLLLREMALYRGNLDVVLSRPCVYGVFSGPLGGFLPREKMCVGCLRCTTEHPEIVTILHHPDRQNLGDSYLTPEHVETIAYEAETGHIPIRGQGYRGKFGGPGWDGMWTDMSEIVRPTRDGIHGREFISTEVDLGARARFLTFPIENPAPIISIPLPFFFDVWVDHPIVCAILSETARCLQTFVVLPLELILKYSLNGEHIIPFISKDSAGRLDKLPFIPVFFEAEAESLDLVKKKFPDKEAILRTGFDIERIKAHCQNGVRCFHLAADYHGRDRNGNFVLDLICNVHEALVKDGYRSEVTLVGSGGIIAAEHVPKAIICGLDAVGLDTAVMAALQARFDGPCVDRHHSRFEMPSQINVEWGTQRLKNLAWAWRGQLLEILGAMGLREVRRLRGEIGRALFQKDLEKDAFAGIEGYESK